MKSIFVSSTFRDFQAERDILNEKVLPELNIAAGQYGETVSFCDLRWGIDTSADSEESATKKILSVCMDQIDRANPYMIILLGERYGYIPGSESIRSQLEQRGTHLTDLKDLEISITQLEIEYGLLTRTENKPHIFVYVRSLVTDSIPEDYASESALHREKLQALLQRILGVAESQVRYYDVRLKNGEPDDLSSFARMVTQDLLTDMRSQWEIYKDMPPFEKEKTVQWRLIDDKKDRLKLHGDLAVDIMDRLMGENTRFLALKGNSGCGKSVLFSYICHTLRQRGMTVIPVLCQSSSVTGDPSLLLEYLIFHLETELGRAHKTFTLNDGAASLNEKSIHRQKLEYLDALCAAVPEDGPPVILALDALDQLYPRQMSRYNAVLPNTLSKNVRVLITAVSDFEIPAHFAAVWLKELSGDAVAQAISGIQSNYRKSIPQAVCHALCQRKAAGNLLYLTMAMMRLCLMNRKDFELINARGGGMAQIQRRQQELVDALPDEAQALAVQLLDSVAAMDSGEGIRRALSYIAVSRGGLRLEDLEQLLRTDGVAFVPLDFYVCIHMLQEFFLVRQDGCIDFQHKIIRSGLLAQLGDDLKPWHSRIFSRLLALPSTDPLKNTEIVYHAYYSDNLIYIPRHVAAMRTYGYFRTVFRLNDKLPRDGLPADFSMDIDYDFYCQQLAADLHAIIMSENIEKIDTVVTMLTCLPPKKEGKDMSPVFWTEFLNKLLPRAFGETDDEQRMLFTVFSCIHVYATELCKNFEDSTAKRNLALCCLQLARLASGNRHRDMNKTALEYIRSYSTLLGELLQEDKNPAVEQLTEYAESRDYLMLLLLQGSRREDMAEVLQIGEALLTFYRSIGRPEHTSRVHFNMGLACEQSGGDVETREKAFQHYMQAITISDQYAQEKKDDVSITYRILSTVKLGNMTLEVGQYANAMQVFSLAYRYATEVYEQLRSVQSRQYVLMAQEGIGMSLLGMGTPENVKQGQELLRATLIQSLSLLREYSTPGVQEMCQRIQNALKQ